MNIRTLASLIVAILLGLVAVVMVRSYLGRAQPAGPGAVAAKGSNVVVANAPILRGAALQPGMLKVVSYPIESVPAGAFTDIAQLTGSGASARLAIRSLAAGEPILADRVSPPGGRANLSGTLVQGMRAISVRSNDVAGVGGFLLPEDRVDVLVTRSIGASNNETITQALAENVRVLGVDQSDDATKPVVTKAITVEVTPDEAQAISLAQSVGSITLSLRQYADVAPLQRRGMTVAELGSGRPTAVKAALRAAPAKPAAPAVVAPQVHVVRGIEISAYPMSQN